ncbi:MAG: ribose-5-phosphate isomerase RpiA [Rhodothermales bacterium]|nr:ribose-5-phosphate isomerase RpiA [Rhodothermales bacterium]
MSELKMKAKQAAADAVVDMIKSGMAVGLGTGSTASLAIKALGERVRREGLAVSAVATSFASERLAAEHGLTLTTLDRTPELDLAFDGADEVDPDLNLIKGRGAAHTREKIVASAAKRFVVLVDESKLVDRLGERMPLPVEVVPMAVEPVMSVLRRLGGEPELRMGMKKDGPVVSDQGMWIVDAMFDVISDADHVDRTLLTTPGVVDHGLFLGMATDVLVGLADGRVDVRTRD